MIPNENFGELLAQLCAVHVHAHYMLIRAAHYQDNSVETLKRNSVFEQLKEVKSLCQERSSRSKNEAMTYHSY